MSKCRITRDTTFDLPWSRCSLLSTTIIYYALHLQPLSTKWHVDHMTLCSFHSATPWNLTLYYKCLLTFAYIWISSLACAKARARVMRFIERQRLQLDMTPPHSYSWWRLRCNGWRLFVWTSITVNLAHKIIRDHNTDHNIPRTNQQTNFALAFVTPDAS